MCIFIHGIWKKYLFNSKVIISNWKLIDWSFYTRNSYDKLWFLSQSFDCVDLGEKKRFVINKTRIIIISFTLCTTFIVRGYWSQSNSYLCIWIHFSIKLQLNFEIVLKRVKSFFLLHGYAYLYFIWATLEPVKINQTLKVDILLVEFNKPDGVSYSFSF